MFIRHMSMILFQNKINKILFQLQYDLKMFIVNWVLIGY